MFVLDVSDNSILCCSDLISGKLCGRECFYNGRQQLPMRCILFMISFICVRIRRMVEQIRCKRSDIRFIRLAPPEFKPAPLFRSLHRTMQTFSSLFRWWLMTFEHMLSVETKTLTSPALYIHIFTSIIILKRLTWFAGVLLVISVLCFRLIILY